LVLSLHFEGREERTEQRLDPGAPVTGNGYELPADATLPLDWHAALARAADSSLLEGYLGAEFVRVFMALKRAECERFNAEPTALDYQWYLRLA
jgi:glutamine synthetase